MSVTIPANKDGLRELDTFPEKKQMLILLSVHKKGQPRPENGKRVQETRMRGNN
jgi:hypothetical protein